MEKDLSNYRVTLLLLLKFQMNPIIASYEKYMSVIY
jgi:hypothetical protein